MIISVIEKKNSLPRITSSLCIIKHTFLSNIFYEVVIFLARSTGDWSTDLCEKCLDSYKWLDMRWSLKYNMVSKLKSHGALNNNKLYFQFMWGEKKSKQITISNSSDYRWDLDLELVIGKPTRWVLWLNDDQWLNIYIYI
jgi:hypothetical protein